ncbi:MAG TPA: prepilin-type N-terminal cleavage/methylation domain-containing protein [Solirubrobacteraceae bacterium]|nr:prepilin-type N-terminal cleavage/methylation domain-containing protein [Solirubrobacteraceae bacterium]
MRGRGEQGFTLIELLVTMTIAVVVFGTTVSILDVFQRHSRSGQLRNENQDSARTAADRIARQLRNVSAPTTGSAGALEQAESYSIVFQTIDASGAAAGENATGAMRVRYCLDDSKPTEEILWTQVQKWKTKEAPATPSTSTCPVATSVGGWETNTRLVEHVTNRIGGASRPVFVYPANTLAQITALEMNLFLNITPTQTRPGETQVTSGVALRNANRPPTASFTVTKINEHVRLNASESLNPDGLALNYKWWKDGTLIASSSQVYETPEKETKGVHTYKLRIEDPSSLSSETERKAEIP